MVIFAAMFIPFITATVLWFWFKRQTKAWEFAIPFVASFILAMLLHFLTSFISASRTEYWTGWITKAEYYEPWSETVHYTERVANGTESYRDSRGKRQTRTKYKTVHRTRTDYHSASWIAEESNGLKYSISSDEYKSLQNRWGGDHFVELNRPAYYEIVKDGDKYVASFDQSDEHMEVATSLHSYENKVVVSRSVFNFPEVDKKTFEELGLIDYPKISGDWEAPSIIGANVPGSFAANQRLSIFNAKHGHLSEVRVWLIVFKEQPLEAAYQQQNYWKNGNMNEFIICVGVDKENNVTWGHSFSWTDVSSLPIEARNLVSDQIGSRIDLPRIVSWVEENIPSRWIRKNFKRDFKYIHIDPPTWAIVLAFILTAGLNAGISFWVIQNEFVDDHS